MSSEIIFTIHELLVFVFFGVAWKILGIGSAERSWGDVKIIKSRKISDLGSDISEEQIIVYTSACIEEERIVKTLSKMDIDDGSHSHSWNDEDHVIDYQLDQGGVETLFQN